MKAWDIYSWDAHNSDLDKWFPLEKELMGQNFSQLSLNEMFFHRQTFFFISFMLNSFECPTLIFFLSSQISSSTRSNTCYERIESWLWLPPIQSGFYQMHVHSWSFGLVEADNWSNLAKNLAQMWSRCVEEVKFFEKR